MNKAIISGNITQDLELKKTQNGKSVLKFCVAVNEGDKADFIDCVAWEKTAELISNYCRKGSKILVEGRNKATPYEKDGKKLKDKFILVDRVEFLGTKDTHQEPSDTRNVIMTKPKWDYSKDVQMPLGGGNRDVTGHIDVNIESDDLPFY